MEIGIFPSIDDGEVKLAVRILIIAGATWIMLDAEETANFFIFLRKKKEFQNISGSEQYHDFVADDFSGSFLMKKNAGNGYHIYFLNEKYEVRGTYMDYDTIVDMLSKEKIITQQIFGLTTSMNCVLDELESLRIKFNEDPAEIKKHAERDQNNILMEMATNHHQFFIDFINAKNNIE